MPKTKNLLILLAIFLMFIMPVFAFAQTGWKGLVPCSNTTTTSEGMVTPAKPCDFNDILTLINKVINFMLFYLAVPIAAIMFAYAGFKLVIAGGAAEARTKAKSIFTNAVIGLILAAAAWLIIKTILSVFGYKFIGTFFIV